MTWTLELVQRMQKLHKQYAEHHTRGWRREMSQLLGVRETQLIAKLGRAYQRGQLKPIYTGHAWHPPKPKPKPPPKPKPKPKQIMMPYVAPVVRQPVVVRTCQFPMWPHNARAPMPPCYCGNKVDEGSSWCSVHRKQVYIPVRPRDRDRSDEFILYRLR